MAARRPSASGPVATYRVTFARPGRAPRPAPAPPSPIPRVTHMLVLAHRIDGMIRSGEIRDWADAARLIGITRARMTQIANLLLLAPAIQESILLTTSEPAGLPTCSERRLRSATCQALWEFQRRGIGSPATHGLEIAWSTSNITTAV